MLRIARVDDSLWDYVPVSCKGQQLKGCHRPGIQAELLQVCKESLQQKTQIALDAAGFDYSVLPKVASLGDLERSIENSTADLSLFLLSVKDNRLQHVSFTTPVAFYQHIYIMKENR